MTNKRISPLLSGVCQTERVADNGTYLRCGGVVQGRMSIMQLIMGTGTTAPILCPKCGIRSVYHARPSTTSPKYLEAVNGTGDDVDALNERECP